MSADGEFSFDGHLVSEECKAKLEILKKSLCPVFSSPHLTGQGVTRMTLGNPSELDPKPIFSVTLLQPHHVGGRTELTADSP